METAEVGAGVRDWMERPLARALILSAALHAALIMVIQPATHSRMETLVIHARIAPLPSLPKTLVPEQPTLPEEVTPQPTPLVPLVPETVTETPPPAMPTIPAGPSSPSPRTAADAEAQVREQAAGETAARGGTETDSGLPRVPVMVDTTWYTARQVDVRPTPLEPRLPAYPEEARRRGIQGSVLVEIQIDQFGRVQDLEIIESDPPGVFDDAVREAYGEARYAPAVRAGQPVRYKGKYRVLFELD